ncbi:MAG: HAMP domain-containing sensor histidine kinase [Rhodothermales bacterium]
MLPLPSPSPAALAAFLLAVAFLGALSTLSVVLTVSRLRPHLLPSTLRLDLMTEQRMLQHARRLARVNAARADRMQAALLDNVSHEFRTPLTGILAAAQILRDAVDTEQRELTEMIIRDSQRMHATLSNVLELVEFEAAAHTVQPADVDLNDVVREALAPYTTFAARKGIALLGPEVAAPVRVVSDPALLCKVIGNLVDNAIKFTDEGEVRVRVRPEGDRFCVDVADTGPGIAKPMLPLLFTPFTQGSQGLSRSHAGTGLGLTVTKRLVDLLGGHITISTSPGSGSVFSISLPIDGIESGEGVSD